MIGLKQMKRGIDDVIDDAIDGIDWLEDVSLPNHVCIKVVTQNEKKCTSELEARHSF